MATPARSTSIMRTPANRSQATFRVNGAYDPAVLEKLNYFLRDWRNNDVTHMDPRLFDMVWEVYRTAGATQPIEVVSAYRSPETNAMLRARSQGGGGVLAAYPRQGDGQPHHRPVDGADLRDRHASAKGRRRLLSTRKLRPSRCRQRALLAAHEL